MTAYEEAAVDGTRLDLDAIERELTLCDVDPQWVVKTETARQLVSEVRALREQVATLEQKLRDLALLVADGRTPALAQAAAHNVLASHGDDR